MALVLINAAMFFFYQSGDGARFQLAMQMYHAEGLADLEWPMYLAYLQSVDEAEAAAALANERNPRTLVNASIDMLQDTDFYRYAQTHASEHLDFEDAARWQSQREDVNRQLRSVSYLAHGMINTEPSLWRMISHQFLHADLMHLLGNMLILVVCGFAVEAALGGGRFLLFYLLAGIGASLLDLWVHPESALPAVGASGAISGVMAMYLGVFRLKTIEFFYWIYVFVGYFRAPALLILPLYIGMELYNYFSLENSNVGFIAHTGGFITGALLLGVTAWLHPEVLNREYLEADDDAADERAARERVHAQLDKMRFRSALNAIDAYNDRWHGGFEMQWMKFALLGLIDRPAQLAMVPQLYGQAGLGPAALQRLAVHWRADPEVAQHIGAERALQLAWRWADAADSLPLAEDIFSRFEGQAHKPQAWVELAQKLAVVYQKLGHTERQQAYARAAAGGV